MPSNHVPGLSRHGSSTSEPPSPSRLNSKEAVMLPSFVEEQLAIQAAQEAYAAAKTVAREAADAYDELQREKEGKKPTPADEEELEELKEAAHARKKEAEAARRRVRDAEKTLERVRMGAFIKIQSERNVQMSRACTHAHILAKVSGEEALDEAKVSYDAARRQKKLDAQAARAEKVKRLRALSFEGGTQLASLEAGWSQGWRWGEKFPEPAVIPPTVWLKPDPPPAGEPPELTAMKAALGKNLGRVIDLFKRWDVDCDHTISVTELRLALGALQVPYDDDSLKTLFDELDEDKSGSIDFEELHHALRKHAPKRVPANYISLELPKRVEPKLQGTGAERRAVAALKKAVYKNMHRLSELFAEWDEDGNGQISKREVKRALVGMCIPVDDKALDKLFTMLDTDESGGIELEELNALLTKEFFDPEKPRDPRTLSMAELMGKAPAAAPAPAPLFGSSPSAPSLRTRPSTVPVRPSTSPHSPITGHRRALHKPGRTPTPSASRSNTPSHMLHLVPAAAEKASKPDLRASLFSKGPYGPRPVTQMPRSRTEPKLVSR